MPLFDVCIQQKNITKNIYKTVFRKTQVILNKTGYSVKFLA